MKPFKFIINNTKNRVPIDLGKLRMFGVQYGKNYMTDRIGIRNDLVLYYGSRYKIFSWVSK